MTIFEYFRDRRLAAWLTFSLSALLVCGWRMFIAPAMVEPQVLTVGAQLFSIEETSLIEYVGNGLVAVARGETRDTISPYEMQAYITACANDWLDVECKADSDRVDLDLYRQRLSLKENWLVNEYMQLRNGCGGCEAEIFAANFDDYADLEVLLRIYASQATTYSYLIFRRSAQSPDEWNFIGSINGAEQHYAPPEQSIFTQNKENCLQITTIGARGTGFAMFGTGIYRVPRKGKPQWVGAYLSSGYSYPFPSIGIDVSATLLKLEKHDSFIVPYLRYEVKYDSSNDDEGISLSNSFIVRAPESGEEVLLNGKFRRLVKDEIGDEEEYLSAFGDLLIVNNQAQILKLARAGTPEQRTRICEFVKNYASSPAARALEKRLRFHS